jgi:sarcosine oxidase subunit alpha
MSSTQSPARLSPLLHTHIALGARITNIDGWQLPEYYVSTEHEAAALRKTVGICDVTGGAILRVKSRQLASDLPTGSVIQGDGLTQARLTDEELLVIGSSTAVDGWQANATAKSDATTHVIDLTSGFVSFKIAGSKSRDLLAAMTDIDLRDHTMPNFTCAQAGFAGVHGTLLRIDLGSTLAYDLLVSREFGEYFWHTALASLPSGSVIPVGHEALTNISGSSI